MRKQLLSFLFIALVAIGTASAKIYRVTTLGNNTNAGTSWKLPIDLATALSQAVSGDQIWVGEGTYYPSTKEDRKQSFTIPEGVKIYGGFTNAEIADINKKKLADYNREKSRTILSGDILLDGNPENNLFHVVTLKGNNTIDGFTITGGCSNTREDDLGAGIYAVVSQDITITNNYITGNIIKYPAKFDIPQGRGAGVYVKVNSGAKATITNNLIANNTIEAKSFLTLPGNLYSNANGAGMYVDAQGATEISDNIISGNVSTTMGMFNAEVYGAGLYVNAQAQTTIANNIIKGNSGSSSGYIINEVYGSGLYVKSSSVVTIANNVISGNTSEAEVVQGAGVYVEGANATLVNNTIVKNKLTKGDHSISGSGVYLKGSHNLYNSIIWGNEGGENVKVSGTNIVAYNLIQGGYTNGTMILDTDPQFVNYAADNFTLKGTSLAINRGDNSCINLTRDLAGNARIINGVVDMGAYESNGTLNAGPFLRTLTVSEGTLTPAFDSAVKAYYLGVPTHISSITIDATALEGGIIKGTGTHSLIVGANVFHVSVTTNATTTYTIVVTRTAPPGPPAPPAKNNDATLSQLVIETSGAVLKPAFSPSVYDYKVDVLNSISQVKITAIPNNKLSTAQISVKAVAPTTKVTGTYGLHEEANKATILVTAEDGTQKTYTIMIYRAKKTTGVEDVNDASLKVYPTLTTGLVYIQSLVDSPELELYSIAGKLLQKTQSKEIDLSDYPKGIYLLRVEGKSFKIVKQ